MPLPTDDNAPTKFPDPEYVTLDNFKRGVITLIDRSRLPRNALEKADNIFLVEDGQPSPRPGVDWFGAAAPNGDAIDGFDYFDFSGVIHLVMVAGGTVYRSTNDGSTWTACSGATLTAGHVVNMNQNNSFLYLTNGVDNIVRYDGSTTLQTYTALTTPSAPTAATTPASPGSTYTYYYKISAVNTVGFSVASSSVTVHHGTPRNAWDSATNYITLTLPAYQATQTRYDIYLSEDNLNYFYLDSVTTPNLAYKDDGSAIVVPSTLAPTDNTTQGPLYAELTNVGSRMYGVRDPNNRYRIGFTGTGTYSGAFASAYDGGYLDWQPGGKFLPVKVADYRDGKGTPLATVWCNSADGQGCVLQMSLDTLTIDNISITVPSAYKLPGSRGTPSPGSVVNVLNDYMFYNTQAIYNIGSRPQLLQVLSTDEYSANIRPTVKTISSDSEQNIASVYFDARVYFSVGFNSSTNNATMIYDTERKAWLPKAFTIGFDKFLRYTDTGGKRRLLCKKPGDNRLSEISADIKGDYGQPFATELLTGLYPATKDRYGFLYVEEMEYEFSNPAGVISVELLGYTRPKGFGEVKAVNPEFSSSTMGTGWDTFAWDTTNWDDTSEAVDTFSESSSKRYTTVLRELNNIQWRIFTNSLASKYVLRSLQTWGTDTEAGHPPGWRQK